MAIAEAKKLFAKSGGQTADGGGQQDVMNSAASQLMKLFVQSKMSGLMGTGSGAASAGTGGGAGGSMFSSACGAAGRARPFLLFSRPVRGKQSLTPSSLPFLCALPAGLASQFLK